ncbi:MULTISPECIES: hypothetical protein [unclassified Streptomyces]|uniref:hypothetical protein n=1 Tax=unclassified Streptomyces TaxID=2593676 RepID=UPI002366A6C7|nr:MULTISPECIES: hypothetical protein [unclassified Streptomyces]MDF3143721.1 hypothetical protein [Streptomyces sp. T21Q-yed]WDF38861.1 hypothetical protein PBV52_19680 [Streptomyces sp. T12]
MNDDELLAHLKAVDPALTSNAPLPDINRLVEVAITHDTTHDTTTRPAPGAATVTRLSPQRLPGAGRRRLLMPAAAVALLVGGGITWGVATNQGQSPSAGPLALTVEDLDSGAPSSACAEPTADTLRRNATAFEGTVTSEEGDRVEFRVDHWYRGGDTTTTTARLGNDEDWPEGWVFEVGQHYLVTAENGVVPVCGGTIRATDQGRDLFRQAFEK